MKRLTIIAIVLLSGCATNGASLAELEAKCNATKNDCYYGETPKRSTLQWNKAGQFYI